MLISLIVKFKFYLYTIGAALVAALAFVLRTKSLKAQRDNARQEAEILKAKVHFNKTEKKIKEKEKKNLSLSLEKGKENIKEGKDEELKNLLDPNNPDNW